MLEPRELLLELLVFVEVRDPLTLDWDLDLLDDLLLDVLALEDFLFETAFLYVLPSVDLSLPEVL